MQGSTKEVENLLYILMGALFTLITKAVATEADHRSLPVASEHTPVPSGTSVTRTFIVSVHMLSLLSPGPVPGWSGKRFTPPFITHKGMSRHTVA